MSVRAPLYGVARAGSQAARGADGRAGVEPVGGVRIARLT